MRSQAPVRVVADVAPDAAALPAVLLAEVLAVRDDLRELRHAVDALAANRPPAGGGAGLAVRVVNAEAIAELLQAIAEGVGPFGFCAGDILDRTPVASQARLRRAIVRAVGAVSPRRIGRLLKRHEGEAFGGLRITRDRIHRDGILWVLERC